MNNYLTNFRYILLKKIENIIIHKINTLLDFIKISSRNN